MDPLPLFEFAPLYIPTDIRKMILAFAAPIHVYIGCVIEDRTYIHVLGAFRTLIQAEKICLAHESAKRRLCHILKIEEGDVLADKIKPRLLSPSRFVRYSSPLYHTHAAVFNLLWSFWMEIFSRKNLRNEFPSPLEIGETVFIDETTPYVWGVGGVRKFVLSLGKTSQERLKFYERAESWKVKIYPKGGGVPRPYKFFVQ